MSDKLSISHFNIDDQYLDKSKGSYVDYVEYAKLYESILEILNEGKTVIIDAVCVLKINNISLNSDLKIYVKCLNRNNYWSQGRNMDYTKSVDEIIKQDRENLKTFSEIFKDTFNDINNNNQKKEFEYTEKSSFHDVLRYHFEYKPDLNSDIIFEERQNEKC